MRRSRIEREKQGKPRGFVQNGCVSEEAKRARYDVECRRSELPGDDEIVEGEWKRGGSIYAIKDGMQMGDPQAPEDSFR